MAKLKLNGFKCARCGHVWMPRLVKPEVCPKCKSPYWDRARKQK